MLKGRFAQVAEALSLTLMVIGAICLCQPVSKAIFTNGFPLLFIGFIGLNIFSHRKPV
jgi:hypothetical protein